MRSMPWAGVLVCRVAKTRWPVSAAVRADSIVATSRISPTRMTSGSSRRQARSPLAKDRVSMPTSLHHDARLVVEEVLHGIFEGHDVELALLVHAVEEGGEGGRLPLPGGARDDDKAALEPRQLQHVRGKAELLQSRDLIGNAPEGCGHASALTEDVDAEAREAGETVGEVAVEALAERLLLVLAHDGEDQRLALLGGESG